MGRGEGNQAKYMETTHTVIALSAHKEWQQGGWLKYPAMVEVPDPVGYGRADQEGHS